MFKPVKEGSVFDAGYFRQFSKGYLTTLMHYINTCNPVPSLLFTCGPSAIGWLVIAINVASFQRKALRAFTHVLQELAEIVAPFRAHGNSASTIIRVLRMSIPEAAIFGSAPRVMLACSSKSVLERTLAGHFSLKAFAALYQASSKMCAEGNDRIAAIAKTIPAKLSVLVFAVNRLRDESTKSNANYIYHW